MASVLNLLLILCGAALLGFSLAFGWLLVQEKTSRAAILSILFGTMAASPFFLIPLLIPAASQFLLLATLAILLLIAILYFAPIGKVEHLHDEPITPFDERDVVFSRARLTAGSPEFEAYYALRPENRAGDERSRKLPGLLSPDAQKADEWIFPAAEACFDLTEALRGAVDGPTTASRIPISPEAMSAYLKGLIRHLGAQAVGITDLHPSHVYSHVGRGSGQYGEPISLPHRFAIAFTLEMNYDLMGRAPEAPVVLESARKYVDGAVFAIQVANLCRRLGYSARAHIDGNYRLIAPLVARRAGLGEIGRIGILMTPNFGPRVRLGVVTTDLPLAPDERLDGTAMIDFCSVCVKCAVNCPSQAIPLGDRVESEGVLRWKIDTDRCFHYWNVIGSDCGICLAVCPYSHPDNRAHTLVRAAVNRSGFARRVVVRLDDLFYGRKPPARPSPDWLPIHPP